MCVCVCVCVFRLYHHLLQEINLSLSAPELANLYLYSYESEFIDRLCVTDHTAARAFHLSFRLIDDLLSMDNGAFDVFSRCLEEGGVYPRSLACGCTSSSLDRVQFCGLDISTRGKGCLISVYDKKSTFPFLVKNYPHSDSNIPRPILYSAFTGQLHRFFRVSSTLDIFLSSVKDMTTKMIVENKCGVRVLTQKFRSFVTRVVWKFEGSKSRALIRFRTNLPVTWLTSSVDAPDDSHAFSAAVNSVPKTTLARPPVPPRRAEKPRVAAPLWGLAYLRDTRAWLRDVDIANICNEIRKEWGRRPWSAFSNFDWRFCYPITLSVLVADLRQYVETFLSDSQIAFTPLNIGGNHWTLVAIDGRAGHKTLVFWDPLGRRFPAQVWRSLCSFFPDLHCFELVSRQQHDGFQCGVWVCWAVDVLISATVDDRAWTVPYLSSLFCDAVSVNLVSVRIRDGEASFIEEVRDTFVSSLQRAASAGSLLVSYSDAVAVPLS